MDPLPYWRKGGEAAMSDSSLSVLLITKDEQLQARCEEEFEARFGLVVHHCPNSEMNETLRRIRPAAVIWDGRRLSSQWEARVSRVREHFPKRPFIALLEGENEAVSQELHRMGINTQLNTVSESYFDTLQVHLFAILLDLEKQPPIQA